MSKIYLDMSGKKGLSPRYWENPNAETNVFRLKKDVPDSGYVLSGSYDPSKRVGYTSPAHRGFVTLTDDGSGSFTKQFNCILYDDVGDVIYAAEDTKIWSMSLLSGTQFTLQRTVSGARITDLNINTVNGIRQLFYTFLKTGASNMGKADLPFASANDTFLSGTVSGGAILTDSNHKMINADNGFMYTIDGNAVHKYDGTTNGGTNGTETPNVLVLPSFYQFVDGVDYKGYICLGMMQSTTDLRIATYNAKAFTREVGIYFWDRLTTTTRTSDYIPIFGVKDIRRVFVSPKGTLRCITTSANNIVQLREYNGTTFVIICETPPGSYPRYPDSLTVGSTFTYWFGDDGYVYSYGSPDPNSDDGLFRLTSMTDSWVTGAYIAGAILYGVNNNTNGLVQEGLLISYTTGSVVNQKRYYMTGTGSLESISQGVLSEEIVYPVKNFMPSAYMAKSVSPKLVTVNYINIFCYPVSGTSTSTSIGNVKIYINQSATAWGSASKNVTQAQAHRGYVNIPIDLPYVNTLQLSTTSTSTPVGGNDFAPYMAEIDFTPGESHR